MNGTQGPAPRWKKRLVLGGIVVFVLALFVFFSPLLGLVKHRFTSLPYLGDKETVLVERDGRKVVDTLYYQVPPFRFTEMSGRPFTERDVDGKIRVVDFFFTRCTTICPKMGVQMQQLQLKLSDLAFEDVVFLSHTVDPEHDTPEVLADYAKRIKANPGVWYFLKGPMSDLNHIGDAFAPAQRHQCAGPRCPGRRPRAGPHDRQVLAGGRVRRRPAREAA